MKAELKRQAILAYKERKPAMGIYAIRCQPSGQVWVGQTRNLDSVENRIWFSLRLRGHHTPSLQHAFALHGREALTFEVLQRLADESTAYPDAELRDLLTHWRERLQAEAL